jgi:hypothetical protein
MDHRRRRRRRYYWSFGIFINKNTMSLA